MNIADIFFGVPLLWAAYKGFKKGFIIEIASLIALLLGIYAATHYAGITGDLLRNKLNFTSEYTNVFAFIITFFAVVLIVFFIAKMIEKFAGILALGFLNKLGGLLFSVLRTSFILSVLIFILQALTIEKTVISQKTIDNSLLYRPVSKMAPLIFPRIKQLKIEEYIPPRTYHI